MTTIRRYSPQWENITDILADGQPHGTSEIAQRINRSLTATSNMLLRMFDREIIVQTERGKYTLPAYRDMEQRKMPAQGTPGVYVLRCNRLFKIGQSDNVAARVAQLQTAIPDDVYHIHTIHTVDPVQLEATLHERFADKRVRGEWFALDMFDIDELSSM